MNTLREVVERHFNTCMREIMNGLPSIMVTSNDDNDYTFDGGNTGGQWTCRTCQVKNKMQNSTCTNCKAKKPDLTFKTGNQKKDEIVGGIKVLGI